MFSKFWRFFLITFLTVVLLNAWTVVQAQSNDDEAYRPIPLSIGFDPQKDASTYIPTDLEQSDNPTRRAIPGNDDRVPVTTEAFPWSAIGRIDWVGTKNDGTEVDLGQCTGTLVGRDLVLTNSHCRLFRPSYAVLNGNTHGNKPLSLKLSKLLKP